MKSYEDELFARDTKLIAKTGEVGKLTQEIEGLRKQINDLKITLKQKSGREIEIAH